MFIGRYYHRVESKGRLSVPKKFRSQLERGAILSQGLEKCLFLYPESTWIALVDKLKSLPLTKVDARNFIRSMSFGAIEAEIDSLGRVHIPDYLREYSGIIGDCVVAGVIDRVEIWDKSRFDTYSNQINLQAEEIAEKINPTEL